MDTREFLGLEATDDPMRWVLPVTSKICTAGNFLFGGCALGAAIAALEEATGRPAVWATAQYLSFANPPSHVVLDLDVPAEGRTISQARAIASVDGREIISVAAALGRRDFAAEGSWATRPDVPPPQDCPRRGFPYDPEGYLADRLELRLASARDFTDLAPDPESATQGPGNVTAWVRMPELLEMSFGALAIVGDYVPFGIGQALGVLGGGNSLDNTIRAVRLVDTEWILLDIRIHAVHHGFGHGLVHLWAEDGTLLATASQSTIVRLWRDAPRR